MPATSVSRGKFAADARVRLFEEETKVMSEWFLADVEKAAETDPDSFFIPSEKERQNQVVGKLVQLHFMLSNPSEKEPRAERMWVTISKVLPSKNGYEGVLENQPRYIKGLNAGDIIKFRPRHIGQVIVPRNDPRWLDIGDRVALVSKLVFEGDKTIRFMYRERPDNEKDSGWRLFSGNETDEYNSDAENIRLCNISWLVDWDPSLLEIFKNKFDAAFERKSKRAKWRQVQDWRPSEEENA